MLIIVLCMIIFLLYSVISTVIIRTSNLKIIKNLKDQNAIALTFDDGPNPLYTIELLDLLKKYDIQATFFVVGQNAEEHPEIIKRMYDEGHTIGIHNYKHVSNWILTPFGLRKQLERTKEVIQQITNEAPVYYRPPWGHFNLSTLLICKDYKVIMWSHILGDWKVKNCKTHLLHKLRQARLKGGSIIVLHDNGDNPGADTEAPKYMLQCLEAFLKESHDLGTQFLPISYSTIRGYNE